MQSWAETPFVLHEFGFHIRFEFSLRYIWTALSSGDDNGDLGVLMFDRLSASHNR